MVNRSRRHEPPTQHLLNGFLSTAVADEPGCSHEPRDSLLTAVVAASSCKPFEVRGAPYGVSER